LDLASAGSQRIGANHLLSAFEVRLDLNKSIDAVSDTLVGDRANTFTDNVVADALLVVPVEPSFGLLASERAALAEGFCRTT
jgi:hypothetical protein